MFCGAIHQASGESDRFSYAGEHAKMRQ